MSQAHETGCRITPQPHRTGSAGCRHPTAGEAPGAGVALAPGSAPTIPKSIPCRFRVSSAGSFVLSVIIRRYFLLPSLLETQPGGKESRDLIPRASAPPRRWFSGSSQPSATPGSFHLIPSIPPGQVGLCPSGLPQAPDHPGERPSPTAPCWGGSLTPSPQQKGEAGTAPSPGSKAPSPHHPSLPHLGAPPAPGCGGSSRAGDPQAITPGTWLEVEVPGRPRCLHIASGPALPFVCSPPASP